MKKVLLHVMFVAYSLFRPYRHKIKNIINKMRGYAIFGKKGIEVYSHVDFPTSGTIIVGEGITIYSNVRFQYSIQSPIHISDNVQIFDHSVIQSIGGGIVIGKNVIIGEYTTIQAQAKVTIEDDVLLASKIQIITNSHIYEDTNIPIKYQKNVSKPILIKKGAWIGINTTILSGVTIGVNSIVGAGSVVNRDVPDYTVVGGVPARIIKKFDFKKNKWESIK